MSSRILRVGIRGLRCSSQRRSPFGQKRACFSSFNNKKDSNTRAGSGSPSWFLPAIVAAALCQIKSTKAEATTESAEKEDWPVFRRSEIVKHNSIHDAWVTFQGNVYNMTPFIHNHPGGHEKILLAAGGDLESYWNLYRQHYNSPTPMEVLARLQIGVLHEEDIEKEERIKELAASQSNNASSDPYDQDPTLSPIMRVLSKQPINAEPPGNLLTDSFLTPNEIFFVRNHHPVPHIDVNAYKLALTIQQGDIKDRQYAAASSLSLDDLRQRYTPVMVTTTIQCGGNRRLEMTDVEKTNGASWQVSAISTAKWTGVSLRELLLTDIFPAYGLSEDDVWQDRSAYQHVHFVGADGMEASIPLRKALQPNGDVILAYAMNDADHIPLEHGFPLRAIAPGHVGVRNVKWVQELRLSREEAYGTWQRGMAYKGFGPSRKSLEGVDVEAIPSLQEQPITSAITSVRPISVKQESDGVQVEDVLRVEGYAYSGGGRGIVRVDVSADGGRTWQDATLKQGSEQPLHRAWAWTFWQTDIPVTPAAVNACSPEACTAKQQQPSSNSSNIEIVAKATDASYNVQPDSVRGIWNLRGINNNAWHRVRVPVTVTAAPDSPESTKQCACKSKAQQDAKQ